VAAHSTTRALYGALQRVALPGQARVRQHHAEHRVLSAGGYANAAAQDTFCSGTSCVITIIYDQFRQWQ